MDITLARTFLEVVASNSFVTAARRLHVTQSTVSARIRSLEAELDRALFHRSKTGVTPTAAGEQFERYATALVRVWEQARHDIALPAGYRAVLAIGAQASLWDLLLLKWLDWMSAHAPDIAIRAERGVSDSLMGHLVDGTLSIAIMYTPQSRPNLKVEKLLDETLVMIAAPGTNALGTADRYVYVDWGPEFQAFHSLHHPQLSTPRLQLDLGVVALRYIMRNGGAGYFPKRMVERHLKSGKLRIVEDAAVFSFPAYMVYHGDDASVALQSALQGLRVVGQRPGGPRS